MPMVVISLDRSPQRLRGVLSRYLLEVKAGTFVGRVDVRIRDLLWEKVLKLSGVSTTGVMIWREPTEQGYAFRTHGKGRYQPTRIDGIWVVSTQGEAPLELS